VREIVSLSTTGSYQHSYLGITGVTNSYLISQALGLPLNYGVLVQTVAAGSPAYHAGISGGSFKVTRGLSTRYPLQVLTSPISEGALAGVAAGMALRGLRPVVEVMFGDFLTLMADQIINHISKVSWMYGETLPLPLVIRTPMGGRRGYGPTHSQTLEKHFLGTPGINVVAPVCLLDGSADPQELLKHIILDSATPTLFIENKLQYLQPVQTAADLPDFLIETIYDKQDTTHTYPIYCLRLRGAPRRPDTHCLRLHGESGTRSDAGLGLPG